MASHCVIKCNNNRQNHSCSCKAVPQDLASLWSALHPLPFTLPVPATPDSSQFFTGAFCPARLQTRRPPSGTRPVRHPCLTGPCSCFKACLKCHFFHLPDQMIHSCRSTSFPCSKTTLGCLLRVFPQSVPKLPAGRGCVCLLMIAGHPYCGSSGVGIQLPFVNHY